MAHINHIPLIMFGIGQVGRTFLSQLMQTRSMLSERYGIELQPVALTDSRRVLFDAAGLSGETLRAAIAAKSDNRSLPTCPETLDLPAPSAIIEYAARQRGISNAIVVDTSSADSMEGPLQQALELGCGVALANKRPLAGPWAQVKTFFSNPLVRFEATVGAGLPVVSTLRSLVDTGDAVQRIQGSLSGSLGYVYSALEEGQSFSEALRAAQALGLTESDPREDLSGRDVARKMLILGRLAGWPLELSDLHVEPVYANGMDEMSVSEFMSRLNELDSRFAAYMGGVAGALRYLAELTPQGGTVSLKAVGERLAVLLQGRLNQVSLWTDHYPEPLTITGPGGGKKTAASAILADCLNLARAMTSPA